MATFIIATKKGSKGKIKVNFELDLKDLPHETSKLPIAVKVWLAESNWPETWRNNVHETYAKHSDDKGTEYWMVESSNLTTYYLLQALQHQKHSSKELSKDVLEITNAE